MYKYLLCRLVGSLMSERSAEVFTISFMLVHSTTLTTSRRLQPMASDDGEEHLQIFMCPYGAQPGNDCSYPAERLQAKNQKPQGTTDLPYLPPTSGPVQPLFYC